MSHVIGNERYVGSDHAPIPAREEVEYAIDLREERFQELLPDFVFEVGPMAEVNRQEVLLTRDGTEYIAFRRRDLFLVQVYSGPEGDVRVMAGSCRRMPFKPFQKPGRRFRR